jgi:hypothetical protein
MQLAQPPHRAVEVPQVIQVGARHDGAAEVRILEDGPRDVALQVAFERQTLKPVFPLDRF